MNSAPRTQTPGPPHTPEPPPPVDRSAPAPLPAAVKHPMTHPAFDAYAFDFDGTLADTADVNHRAVRASLAAHGVTVSLAWVVAAPVFTAAQLRRRLGLTPAALPEETFVEAARAYWLTHTDLIRPIHATARIARAAAAHAPVAVVSANYSDIVRRGLTVVGLDDLPWTVVGRDDVPHAKPAPDAYLHAARLLDVAPGRCLAHEDTDDGIAAATAAGMNVVDIRRRPWQ
ncbi:MULTISPECIES: HAD family phosphatase [unclassified Streptomyces]|uniref:HAD family hydrolase n=2 Tax=Streptomyces TaxID=1883 RepID=UPI002E2B607F|nr:HAD family phosphatase [Streptomyces sp. NBC_00228]